MQIFVLDLNPETCAGYHCDKHVVKQILESAQLLSTTCRLAGLDVGYKVAYQHHPCRIWSAQAKNNFQWLCCLAFALCTEYTFRYEKVHKSQAIILQCQENIDNILWPRNDMTPFAQAMPEQYKNQCAVTAYRAYYNGEKKRICKYTKREMPFWII